jgi:hypothetical protein
MTDIPKTLDIGDEMTLHSGQVRGCYLRNGIRSAHSAIPGRYRVVARQMLARSAEVRLLKVDSIQEFPPMFVCGEDDVRAILGDWSDFRRP